MRRRRSPSRSADLRGQRRAVCGSPGTAPGRRFVAAPDARSGPAGCASGSSARTSTGESASGRRESGCSCSLREPPRSRGGHSHSTNSKSGECPLEDPQWNAVTGRVRAAPPAGSRPPARLECAARPARGRLAHQSGGVRGRQEMGAGRASTCWPATFAERTPASVPELQWLGRRSCWRRSAAEHGARAQAGPRAASTASRTRSGPKRITSSATTPQACSVAASSARAARSSSGAVLSATAATRAGRTGRQTAS